MKSLLRHGIEPLTYDEANLLYPSAILAWNTWYLSITISNEFGVDDAGNLVSVFYFSGFDTRCIRQWDPIDGKWYAYTRFKKFSDDFTR